MKDVGEKCEENKNEKRVEMEEKQQNCFTHKNGLE